MNRRVAAVMCTGVLLALTAGCSARRVHLIDGEWAAEGGRHPHLTLDKSGQMSGHDGCNGLGGRWEETAPGVIGFSEMIMSAALCFDLPDQWLGAMRVAIVKGDTLVCRGRDGEVLGTLHRVSRTG